MARMNWSRVRTENLVRSQGTLRVPPEQAWTRPRPKRRKKKTRSTQAVSARRPLKECPNCHAMVREARFERHVNEACVARRGIASRTRAARSMRPAPDRARIVGPADEYVTCPCCAVEVLAPQLPAHHRRHKAMPSIVTERQAARFGVRAVSCSRCGGRVRVDLLKTYVAWHVPDSRRVVREPKSGLPPFVEAMASRGGKAQHGSRWPTHLTSSWAE